jgi:uncharacterized protein (UPF0371 family)
VNKTITELEEISLNSFPSLQTILYDGWVLRFANGYTKRANSVNPLYYSTYMFDEKLKFCEKLFNDRKLETAFKITSQVYPSTLDSILSDKGYRQDSFTSVQCLELTSCYEINNSSIHID